MDGPLHYNASDYVRSAVCNLLCTLQQYAGRSVVPSSWRLSAISAGLLRRRSLDEFLECTDSDHAEWEDARNTVNMIFDGRSIEEEKRTDDPEIAAKKAKERADRGWKAEAAGCTTTGGDWAAWGNGSRSWYQQDVTPGTQEQVPGVRPEPWSIKHRRSQHPGGA